MNWGLGARVQGSGFMVRVGTFPELGLGLRLGLGLELGLGGFMV